MDQWISLIIGDLDVMPEVIVLVKMCGALFLLEIATSVVAFLGGRWK